MDAFKGLKLFGGSAKKQTPTRTEDTLFSDDVVEIVLGLSEGPIVGLENGAASFFIGDTPLVDSTTGNPSFGNFDLTIHKGVNPPDVITPRLGGFGTTHNVGVALEQQGSSVIRQGTETNIDFLEVRVAIHRLVTINDNGDFPATIQFQIDFKPASATVWSSAYSGAYGPPASHTSAYSQYLGQASQGGHVVNPAYRETYVSLVAPTARAVGAIWFDATQPMWPPKVWNGGSWVVPVGLSSAHPPGELFRWQWPDGSVTRRAFYNPAGDKPAGFSQYDFLLSPAGSQGDGTEGDQVFIHNGSAWVNYMEWAEPPVSQGHVSISDKASSTVIREFRLPVSQINEPYQVRVTRLSGPNTSEYFADIAFESFQELRQTPFYFPDLAVAHLTIKASDQFSSLPEFTGVYKGRTPRVPTNYNPETRTYSGLWDGTFKLAYTNNPAWIAYDLVMDDQYGMNAYYPIVLDKFAAYDFARHCDTFGFTYNEYVTEARRLSEAVNFICGLAGGRFVDQGDGYATIIYDADAQGAVALFTPENIIDGVFTYSFTDITARHNDITVSFINPELNWREDRVRVFDQAAISEYGRNPEEFIAVGCIDEVEAVKRGRLRLATALTEKTIVTFKTNRQGLYLTPFQVILIGDEDNAEGLTGRVKSVISPTQVTLRDPVFLESGFTYKITFQTASGLVERTLAPASGNVTVLHLTQPLTVDLPEFAVFTIEHAGSIGVPKPYRITAIDEVDGEPDDISITAIEVNRQKWAFVNGEVTLRDVISTGPTTSFIEPVSNVRITPTTTNGRHDLLIEWDPSPSPLIRYYRVYARIGGGDLQIIGEPRQTRYLIEGALPATYIFSIVAVSIDGHESPPVTFEHQVTGAARVVAPPTNLRVVDGPDLDTFNVRSPLFSWDASTDPYLASYLVEVLDPSTLQVLRSTDFQGTTWQYTYEMNAQDHGGTAARTFRLRVRARDTVGNLSAATGLIATNPQVGAPQLDDMRVFPYLYQLYVEVDRPEASDWAGMVVHASTTQGFTPSPATQIYDGPDTLARGLIREHERKYVRVAFYDTFGKDQLAYSPEVSVTGLGLNPGTVSFDMLTRELRSDSLYPSEVREIASQLFEDMVDLTNTQEEFNEKVATTRVELEQAIETESEARILALSHLSARVGTAEASITELDEALATETQARASQVTALTARVGTAEGKITTLETVTSNGTFATATSVTALTARVGTAEGDISTTAQSVVNLQGEVRSQWFVKLVNINGGFKRIAGFGLSQFSNGDPTGGSSEFVVQADGFLIVPPVWSGQLQNASPVFAVGTRFGVASVGIKGDMVLDGTITANHLNVITLSAITGNLGEMIAGLARSIDSKFVVNFNDRYLAVYD